MGLLMGGDILQAADGAVIVRRAATCREEKAQQGGWAARSLRPAWARHHSTERMGPYGGRLAQTNGGGGGRAYHVLRVDGKMRRTSAFLEAESVSR